jgi:hypothetical protein
MKITREMPNWLTALLAACALLAGCGPWPIPWEKAQVLAARCEAKGLKPAYQEMYTGGTVYWVQCQDPSTGAIFVQDQS